MSQNVKTSPFYKSSCVWFICFVSHLISADTLSCLRYPSRLWRCEAGPQDQITKWSGEDTFLFHFITWSHFLLSPSPHKPPPLITASNWPVTWSLKVSRFCRAVLMQTCLAEHELCRRETRRACNYFVACVSLCLPLLTAALSPCCCRLYRTARALM